MPEIHLPTKAMQEAIKLDTENIKSGISTVNSEISSMIADGLGTDWSKYTPFYKNSGYTPKAQNVYETMFEVTGEGYLSKAIIKHPSNSAYNILLRITIDGVVKYNGTVTVTPNLVGVIEKDYLYTGTNNEWLTHLLNNLEPIGVIDTRDLGGSGTPNRCMMIGQPLFFNEHLKIEISFGNSFFQRVNYEFIGGVRL